MKKRSILTLLLTSTCLLASCGGNSPDPTPKIDRVEDLRKLSMVDYTVNNLTSTDVYGRVTPVTDLRKDDKKVGVFYHIWHGTHNTGIFNITELLANDPDSLNDPLGNPSSPLKAFHYWGEPLYGYYNSSDPWVISRHMELLTMAGCDYLVYDLTNTVIYYDAINSIFEVLDKFQKQGFNVPKVAFYTNSASAQTMKTCYETWYKTNKYSNLWFSLDGSHPLIIGKSDEIYSKYGQELYDEMTNFFQIKESQWPDATRFDKRNGFPWMDWDYPQLNYSGTMSVSLAQHPGMRMSEESQTNHGRGFDYATYKNDDSTAREGTNVEGQWKTVFDNIDKVNNVFVTGWNEWIAQKMADGAGRVYFVDTYNENYSRDMEMCKNGYGDNFYLQFTRNIRKYAYTEAKHYIYNQNTIDITDFDESKWNSVQAKFLDFEGDAQKRDFVSADKVTHLLDDSNRNDIVKTYVTHDSENVYFRVECASNITSPSEVDKAWMNIMINTGKNVDNFSGYDFVINRSVSGKKTSIERLKDNFVCEKLGEADIEVNGKVMQVKAPLSIFGLSKDNYTFSFKVCDNIQVQKDILDYYVSGDSAPIGRLNYSYGF